MEGIKLGAEKGSHQGSPIHFKIPRSEERLLFMTGLSTCSALKWDYPTPPKFTSTTPGDGTWELGPLIGDTVRIITSSLHRTYVLWVSPLIWALLCFT